jgi:hypothetical protein
LDSQDDIEIYEENDVRDLLQLDSIYLDRTVVDCVGTLPTQFQVNLVEASDRAIEILTNETWLLTAAICNTFGNRHVPIIFDTGASLAITPDVDDFIDPPTSLGTTMKLGGMANNLEIRGVGTVCWTFEADDGSDIQIRTQSYWVPKSKARLLSSQKLFNKKSGTFGRYEGDEDEFRLFLNGEPTISVPYDTRSSLPIWYAQTGQAPEPQVNVTLIDENQNITEGQKLFLEWHTRFDHLNFPRIQQVLRNVHFIAKKYATSVRCDPPKCHTCQLAKSNRRPKKASVQTIAVERDGALKSGNLKVGANVSVDHFESRLLGRTYDSYGKPSSAQFVGGTLFVDHASGLIHCEHQVEFSAVETIRVKQSFERHCMDEGVILQDYLTDSGAFKANKFVSHIHERHQLLSLCGTNAHHQNGIAERAIQSISSMARAMILHAIMHWKDGIDASLWPMEVTYTNHIYNSTPKDGVYPLDIFTGSTVPWHRLMDMHVWGCPVYVLDPKVQQGRKLPRRQP